MCRQIALLRGINLGTRNRISMAALRQLLGSLGYDQVSTYLQSGNAILTAHTPPEDTARAIHDALDTRLGLDIDVLVRTPDELSAVCSADPFGELATDATRYLVQFLDAEPDAGLLADLDPAAYLPERYTVDGRELYLWLPNGVHSARLPAALGRLGIAGTARSWRTVVALAQRAAQR